jgi:hypothetical protein
MQNASNFTDINEPTKTFITFYPIAYFGLFPFLVIGVIFCVAILGDAYSALWAFLVVYSYFLCHYAFLVCTMIFFYKKDHFAPTVNHHYVLYIKVYSIVYLVTAWLGIETARIRELCCQTKNRNDNQDPKLDQVLVSVV